MSTICSVARSTLKPLVWSAPPFSARMTSPRIEKKLKFLDFLNSQKLTNMPNGVQLLGGVLRGRHLEEQLSDVSVVGQAGVVAEDAAVFWNKKEGF